MSTHSSTILDSLLPIRYSARAKRLSVVVHWDGRWEIIVPARRSPSVRSIQKFVGEHWEWIQAQVSHSRRNIQKRPLTHRGIPRARVEQKSRELIHSHLAFLCDQHAFGHNKVRVGDFSSQWGSCSEDLNLSFHYKLSLLPAHLCFYVVAHELCHTVHFDHSKAFWMLLETICPNAKQYRNELRQYLL